MSDVFKANVLEGIADKFNSIIEAKYASNVREPLGRGVSRAYQWPNKTFNGSIAFGVPSVGLQNAKEAIYPRGGAIINSDEATHALYRKTHGNFGPGEQKHRDYNWNFDLATHRFGYAEKPNLNGASKALRAERLEEEFPKTVIIKKTVDDFQAVNNDILGVSKNLGQG